MMRHGLGLCNQSGCSAIADYLLVLRVADPAATSDLQQWYVCWEHAATLVKDDKKSTVGMIQSGRALLLEERQEAEMEAAYQRLIGM